MTSPRACNVAAPITTLPAFGDYFHELNHTVITKPLAGGEGASPFLAALKGKRLVNMVEAGECDTIQAEQPKRISGNENLVARDPYERGSNPIAVTWKAFLSANDAPDISSAAIRWRGGSA